jgi:hypothetical protein
MQTVSRREIGALKLMSTTVAVRKLARMACLQQLRAWCNQASYRIVSYRLA